VLLLLPLLAVAEAAGPALPADLAEADRLREDLELMAARAVWDGVERAYLALMALEARGVVLTVEDHRQGAQAAITRGEIAAARERLVRARSLVAGTLAEARAMRDAAAKAAKAAKASPKIKKALARSGTTIAEGTDVLALLVAAIKRAVDTGDYENARQILGLLEKQR
jgi:hypothetical protein